MRPGPLITVAVLLASLAACSIPEKQLAATGPPYACLGQPLPTTASAKLTIGGLVLDPFTGDMIPNAAVEGFLVGTTAPIFTTQSDGNGAFSQDQGTGGVPRNAYLKVSPNGYLPTYYYPAVPIAQDLQIDIQMLTSTDVMTIGSVGGVAIDPTKGNFLVVVVDCNGMPISGATVTTVPAGTVRYFVNFTPSATAVATDEKTGAALVANVPLSNTTINATVGGMTLRSHNFDAVAGAIMLTEIQP
jgi:hypothetical protein